MNEKIAFRILLKNCFIGTQLVIFDSFYRRMLALNINPDSGLRFVQRFSLITFVQVLGYFHKTSDNSFFSTSFPVNDFKSLYY